MKVTKRVFIIGDFKLHTTKSIRIERRHWIKGLMRAGCDVQSFSYRNITKQFSPFERRAYALKFGRKRAEHALLEQIKTYHPNIVLIVNMKDIRPDCLQAMRDLAPRAVFVGRDVDPFPECDPERMEIASKMDIVLATNAGTWLQRYKDMGVPLSAFIPCPCDPDIQCPYDPDPCLKTDVLFTGKAAHGRMNNDPERFEIIDRLTRMQNARVFGTHGTPEIAGIDVFRATSNAKIALSINANNNQRMYHSDRFVNCISCGTFTLAKRVPDSDLLFQEAVEAKYFEDTEEFFELVDWYLKHDDEREKIARAGMKKARAEFNCTLMAQRVLDLIETGDYSAPWRHVLS